jgi:hypothetical protein
LDGTGDYVSIADPGTNSVFDFGSGESITISAWINPTNLPATNNWDTIVSKNRSSDALGNYYFQYEWNGKLDLCLSSTAPKTFCWTTTSAPVTTGSWQHVAVEYTFGTPANIKIFHNGTSYAGAWDGNGSPTGTQFESNDPVIIGGDTGGIEQIDGKIDDVRIYSALVSDANIAIIGQPGYDIEARSSSSYPGIGFSWSSATVVYNGSSATNLYYYPAITRDSNSKVWINSTQTSGTNYIINSVQSSSANSITAWGTATVLDTSTNSNKYGSISPLASGHVYATWIDNATIQGCVYDADNGGGARWENSAGSDCTNGANQDSIATGKSGLSSNISMSSDTSNNLHLAYIDGSNYVQYKKYSSGAWDGSATRLDTSATNNYVTVSVDTSNNNVYVIYLRSSTAYYKKYSGSWGSETDTGWTEGTSPTNLTSNYSASGRIFAEWTSGSGSPYTVNWDKIIVPENILALIVLAPFIPRFLKKKRLLSKVVDRIKFIRLCRKLRVYP